MADIRARKELFSWTDDEVGLLLHVTLDYKTTKIQENVDWESCKPKYSEIGDLFQAQYPRTPTEKDFPHDKNSITQGQLTAKQSSLTPTLGPVIVCGVRFYRFVTASCE